MMYTWNEWQPAKEFFSVISKLSIEYYEKIKIERKIELEEERVEEENRYRIFMSKG